jgi:hypothetical protein
VTPKSWAARETLPARAAAWKTAMARSGRCIGSCGMGKGATATATLG